MLGKNDIRDTLIHEYKVIKQLIGKLPEGSDDFRLSETQRSTVEVLRYLALLGPGILHAANDQGFKWFGENAPAMENVGVADMPSYMDGAVAEMTSLFEGWSEDDFATKEVSIEGMGDWTLQNWVLNTACKFLPSYKLMLFHHAKAAGNTDIGTWDAWMDDGDTPKPDAG